MKKRYKFLLAFGSLALSLISANQELQYLLLVSLIPVLVALNKETNPWVGGLLSAIAAACIPLSWSQGTWAVSAYLFLGLLATAGFYAFPGAVVAWANQKSSVAIWYFAPAWVAIEFVQGNTGFWGGWANPGAFGYGLHGTAFMQLASLSSVTAVTLGAVLCNLCLYKISRYSLVLLASLFLVVGYLAYPRNSGPTEKPFSVAVIQGALPNELLSSYSEESTQEAFTVYTNLTKEARKQNPDLIIWPESALRTDILPGYIDPRLKPNLTNTFIAGGYFRASSYYNAAFLWIGGKLSGIYLKEFPIPIAEKQFASGGSQKPLVTLQGKVGIRICFESAFAYLARQSVRDGADLLVMLVNDTWAKHSNLAQWHLRVSQFRAVETGRYIVHASQYGPSAVISHQGVIAQTALGERTVLYANMYKSQHITLFVLWGNWVGWICVFVLAVVLWRVGPFGA
jgi:apolipoprotein N-acyltransferase